MDKKSESGFRDAPRELWESLKPLARQMRHDPTPTEDLLWQRLRNRQIADTKFRRQHAIERFIVDFYCSEASLVIEVDGSIHDYTAAEDAIRQEFLESQGLQVLRFTTEEITTHIKEVLARIQSAIITRKPPTADEKDDSR